ncbi:MAG: PIG-L family deacetylase [Planctomycetales bacterium]|nr:PIG-L family deacetylase [bacterium]UNM08866.1 MAG: PIG-L family deacetylase [Planctomycetales bacterium]
MSDLIYGDSSAPKLDVLVFGPHPDDAEIGAGGLLLKLAAQGRKTGIVDLTRGEMGSGGNVAIREQESIEAAKILKVSIRENMNLPDCGVEDTMENRRAVARLIAKYRPEVVLGTYYELPPGRGLGHNDHIKGGLIVAHGANYAHLKKMDLGYDTWHARATYFYFLPPTLMPSFVVDVTPWHEEWLASIYAHESQFGRADQNPGIRDFFGANAMRWGRQARGKYAQAFYSPWPIALDSVMTAAGMDGLQA